MPALVSMVGPGTLACRRRRLAQLAHRAGQLHLVQARLLRQRALGVGQVDQRAPGRLDAGGVQLQEAGDALGRQLAQGQRRMVAVVDHLLHLLGRADREHLPGGLAGGGVVGGERPDRVGGPPLSIDQHGLCGAGGCRHFGRSILIRVTAADRDRLRDKLLALKTEILNEGDVAIEPVRKDAAAVGNDEDEQPLAEMQQVIASKRNRARTEALGKVLAALKRLDDTPDEFGLCIDCGDPIGKRLEAMPYVDLCVECQAEKDSPLKGQRRRHLTDYK
jgi:DnaK suppressor protein